jgi:hypothetical protein
MLTVPGLCWLCRMPLALSGGASAPSARDRCNGVSGSVHNVVYRPQTLFALWPLPEKIPAVERAGGGG